MGPWLRFFVGTPQRLLLTLGGLTLIFGLFNPEMFGRAVNRLLTNLLIAVAPLEQPLLTLAIIMFAIWVIWRGTFGRPRGKK